MDFWSQGVAFLTAGTQALPDRETKEGGLIWAHSLKTERDHPGEVPAVGV